MIKNDTMRRQVVLYSAGAIVGVCSGLTAVFFRYLIFWIGSLFVIIPQTIGLWGWVLIPALGGCFVAIIVLKYAPETKGHGVPEVMEVYALRGGQMRVRVPLLKSIASAITIGSGGSAGREGPIAQIGAGVGSAIAELFKFNKRETKTLVVAGLSSGIAATFNAPLGGALFGIEVIAGGIVGFSLLPVILASVVAVALSQAILGSAPSFIAPAFQMGSIIELSYFLVLGIILGVISVVWIRGLYIIEDLLERLRIWKYALPAVGGLFTGLIALLVLVLNEPLGYNIVTPPGELDYPAVLGANYSFMNAALAAQVGLSALVVFGALKFLATAFTLGSGGSGGIFAPTFFMGAAFGGAMGWMFKAILPGLVPMPMVFALVGIAALFAGTARAPITCIVMIMEMTGDYIIILPLMIAVSSSFLVSSLLEPDSIDTKKLARRGLHIRQGSHIGALQTIAVSEIMTKHPTTLSPLMKTSEVLEIIDKTHHTKFPVVDDFNNVLGILIAEDLFHERPEDGHERTVQEVMNPEFLHLAPGCTMDSALKEMIKRDQGHAVIADSKDPRKMLGYITKADVLKAYDLSIFRLQKEGIDVEDIEPADIIDVT
jgi:CIC family chloride channel protein